MTQIKLYIYTIFALFITANIMRELIITRNKAQVAGITTQFFVAGNMQDCAVKTLQWSFFLPNCQQYHQGELLEISGSHQGETDNGFFQRKRLKVQAVSSISLSKLSVKYWWQRAQIFINHSKQLLLKNGLSYLPPTHARLIASMVFGGTASLPQELKTDFQITGLTHVVSASGYNVSVVAGLAMFVFSRFLSPPTLTLVMMVVVWVYAIAAELVPPVVRASVMISLNLLASRVFLRQYNVLFSLVLTVGLMLWIEPFYVRSLSFWLSTLATLGIILILPLLKSQAGWFASLGIGDLTSSMRQARSTNVFQESLLVTLAAQSLTLPLVAIVFGEVSLLSFVTNTLLLWLAPLMTVLGLGLMVAGAVFSFWPSAWVELAPLLSLGVWLPTELFITSVRWFGQFKWGLVKIPLPW